LLANGSRECAPDDRLHEAIHLQQVASVDCFAALAMTIKFMDLGYQTHLRIRGEPFLVVPA
jgi:hypothetical protein